jgi:hypothetical protein
MVVLMLATGERLRLEVIASSADPVAAGRQSWDGGELNTAAPKDPTTTTPKHPNLRTALSRYEMPSNRPVCGTEAPSEFSGQLSQYGSDKWHREGLPVPMAPAESVPQGAPPSVGGRARSRF